MSASSDEFKLQWSVSLPPVAQYAKGHMFNFRADTVEEMEDLFDEVLESETIQKALDVANLLTAADVVNNGTKDTGDEVSKKRSERQGSQKRGAKKNLRTCEHGVRTKRTGTNSRGDWTGYFCPLEKGDPDQCDPEWEDS